MIMRQGRLVVTCICKYICNITFMDCTAARDMLANLILPDQSVASETL